MSTKADRRKLSIQNRKNGLKGGRPKGAIDSKKRNYNPKCLENLKGHGWKPGQSGNPSGLPKNFTPVARWVTLLGGHSIVELKDLMKPSSKRYMPINKIIAIEQLLRAVKKDASGAEFDRIADRQTGKPHQSTTVVAVDERSPGQLLEEARRRLLWGSGDDSESSPKRLVDLGSDAVVVDGGVVDGD